ncbi:hypothetical protein CVU37_12415 [candidate division BRC1 bacterium HGW-BRC1-1]|jgi:hypothetical protein|nr:MAG: hypothetical protein CVU37_12415 [candidate division BRC1 bacterium HGW-BRC1-1]
MALVLDIVAFLVICIAAWGAGAALLRCVPLALSRGERVFLEINAGFSALSFAVFALGIPHWVNPPVVLVLLFICAACLLVLRPRVDGVLLEICTTFRTERHLWWPVSIVALVSVAGLGGALSPEVRGDPIIYHVSEAMLFAVNGGHVDIPSSVLTYIPQHFQMLVAMGLVIATDVTGKLLHWFQGELLLFGAALLALRLGASRVQAAWAAALLALVPIWMYLATAIYVDLPVANAIVCAVLIMTSTTTLRPASGAWAGFFLGTAMGSKYTAAVVGAVPLGLLMLLIIWRERTHRRRLFLALSIMTVATMITFAPWAIRNAVWTGNPLAPSLMSVLGPADVPASTLAWPDIQSGNPALFLHPLQWLSESLGMFVAFSDYQNVLPLLALILGFTGWLLRRARKDDHKSTSPRESDMRSRRRDLVVFCLLTLLIGVPLAAVRRDGRYVMAHMAILSALVVVFRTELMALLSGGGTEMLWRRRLHFLSMAVVAMLFASWVWSTRNRFQDLNESLWPAWSGQARISYQRDRLQGYDANMALSNAGLPIGGKILGAGYPARVNYVLNGTPITPDLAVQEASAIRSEHLPLLRRQGVDSLFGLPPPETRALLRLLGSYGGKDLYQVKEQPE